MSGVTAGDPPGSLPPWADAVELTRALVAVESVNPALEASGSGEGEMARLCAGFLESAGFRVEVKEVNPGRPNVVATLGETGPTLLLNGHLDTVGVKGMSVDPLGGDSDDERIVGRGAADMKSGLAAILVAARDWAARRKAGARGTLLVALTCDEEHASLGMQHLVDGGVAADAAVVTEPTSLAVMPAHKGFSWVEVVLQGRAAHGSRPELGVDAVRHAAAFLQELDVLEVQLDAAPPHPLLGHGSFHVGTVAGGSGWSIYPDRCVLRLERRTLPGEPGEGLLHEVEAALARTGQRIPELDAAVRLDLVRPPSDVSPDAPVATGLLAALESEGMAPTVAGMTAWVDAAFLNRAGIPAVCFGPGSIGRAHAADEWVSTEEVRVATRVLGRFVAGFLDEETGAEGRPR